MLLTLLGGALVYSRAWTADADKPPSALENSVVKVFSTMRNPDLTRPWTKQAPVAVTGSGVVIEGRRILTNAHVVRYATQVQIQANQAGDKLSAKVIAVAPGIDLAVLALDDDSFFKTHVPISRANRLPEIKDAVLAYGYPAGGTTLSITKGIVSRIEFVQYSYDVAGLRIQIDAAINPGNSGGPAIAGDQMIGLAFSHLSQAQNIGYIIPNEEIDLFLKDIADGHYDGKPALYGELQTLENPALRAYLKLDKSIQGVVVRKPYEEGATALLRQWDVITRIADTPIDDQGMVKVSANLRLAFNYLVQKAARDGHVTLAVLREGKPLTLSVPVYTSRPLLMPDLAGDYPPYFIYGPLVFSKATLQFLGSIQQGSQRGLLGLAGSRLVTELGMPPHSPGEELVVVASPFFPHASTNGYQNPQAGVVSTVNGVHITSLRHLVETLRDLKDDYVTLQFDNADTEALVFRRTEMIGATEDILTDNGVRAQASPELLAVWNAAAAH